MRKKTIIYIDGFNLFYGALKGTGYKWLDLFKLGQFLMAGDDLLKIKYFTALVDGRNDPRRPMRQQVYWRALKALHGDQIEIVLGHFRSDVRSLPLADGPGYARVIKTEEKGSDVNLVTHLLIDAWKGNLEQALVISNDSDLAPAIKIAQENFHLPIGVSNPSVLRSNRCVVELESIRSFKRTLRDNHLQQSQLPAQIPGTAIHKPPEW